MTNDNDRTKIVEQPTPLRWGCVLHQCEDSKWLVSNARGTHWWYSFDEIWEVEPCNFQRGWADTSDEALKDFAKCQTPPPDWTEPEPERIGANGHGITCKCQRCSDYWGNVDSRKDDSEQPERFDEFTGPSAVDAAKQIDDNENIDGVMRSFAASVILDTSTVKEPPPTTDPASRAIASHTTPGQSTDITPTMPEMLEIANATCLSFQHLELALTRYGLRAYKAGQDYVLNHLKGQNR